MAGCCFPSKAVLKEGRRRGMSSSTLAVVHSKKPGTAPPEADLPAAMADELFHFGHPQHLLVRVDLPYLFTCMGCKEHGAGKRFRCHICEYDLHDFCALAPPFLHNHPFHQKHQLIFFTRPGGLLRSRCDVCGKACKGYGFHCTSCSFQMHPCCMSMHAEMVFPTHQHPLRISSSKAAMAVDDLSSVCNMCHRKRSGQMYRCLECNYSLHAVCAKVMVNGLYVHGIMPPEKASMLGTAAKVAADAFFGILGGLVEGIGEGIGEAIIESIGRDTTGSIKGANILQG